MTVTIVVIPIITIKAELKISIWFRLLTVSFKSPHVKP